MSALTPPGPPGVYTQWTKTVPGEPLPSSMMLSWPLPATTSGNSRTEAPAVVVTCAETHGGANAIAQMAPRRRTRLRDIQPPESDAILRTYRVRALYQAAFGKEKRNSLRKKEFAPPRRCCRIGAAAFENLAGVSVATSRQLQPYLSRVCRPQKER